MDCFYSDSVRTILITKMDVTGSNVFKLGPHQFLEKKIVKREPCACLETENVHIKY